MRAVIIHKAKDLRVEEYQVDELGPGQVRINMEAGGVCGSDLHYFNHGGFGTVRLREPMVLGHEVSGRIEALGEGVDNLEIGELVSVSPSRPCGGCGYCAQGLPNHCEYMRFYGSAMPFPHIQGAFREVLVANASQCVKANGLTAGEAAMAEPLSVCLHATRRAGEMLGKRVLVTGCGPIGLLIILVARRAGATEIIATDLSENALTHAKAAGADRVINVADDPEALNEFTTGKGTFDVMFEASGANIALNAAIPTMRPRGIVMQLGMGGDMTIPMQQVTVKELDLRGCFRFHEEFHTAVALMQKGLINVKPLITHTMTLDDALAAFEIANDRSQAIKAQISFS
ncbi:MAG: L-idonate 5-dehydrogenase [Rhizobiaceae bacterium]|nr:L-idonate 5-dehydrogenase [Rhizobiaceae bacterium]